MCAGATYHVNDLDLSVNKLESGLNDKAIKLGICKLLQKTNRLMELNLAQSNLGDEGMSLFAAGLQHNSTLRRLNLSENKIAEIGSRALAQVSVV